MDYVFVFILSDGVLVALVPVHRPMISSKNGVELDSVQWCLHESDAHECAKDMGAKDYEKVVTRLPNTKTHGVGALLSCRRTKLPLLQMCVAATTRPLLGAWTQYPMRDLRRTVLDYISEVNYVLLNTDWDISNFTCIRPDDKGVACTCEDAVAFGTDTSIGSAYADWVESGEWFDELDEYDIFGYHLR